MKDISLSKRKKKKPRELLGQRVGQRRISRNHTESAVLLLKVTRSANTRWRPARKMNSVNYKLMFFLFNLWAT